MLIPRFTLPLIILLIGLLLLAAIFNIPLTKEYRLLAPNDLTTEQTLLTPDHTIKQTYQAHALTQSGVRIFTNTPVLTDQELSVQITNDSNQLLATGQLTNQTLLASNDAVVLDYSLPWFNTTPNQPLSLTISLTAGSQLPINISARNTYHGGALYLDDIKQPGDLALATIHPSLLINEARNGAIIGIVLMIAAAFIITFLTPLYQWLAAAILLVIVTPLSLLGFWFSTGDLGIADWDLYFSYHEVIRRTILTWHVFPFWNPWLCGGTAALGDPEFPLFTLTFLLELIFGIPTGFPLAIYLSIATTAVGLLFLAKRLRFSLLASLLTAIAGTFGGVTIIEIVEGHPNVFAAMWIPWIFWAWLGAYRQHSKNYLLKSSSGIKKVFVREPSSLTARFKFMISNLFLPKGSPREDLKNSDFEFSKWSLLCGLFLALTFYAGGIYLLMYTILSFILITFLVHRPLTAILTTFTAGLWALGLAALKLFPVLFWLSNFPDKNYAGSAFSLPYLTQILFGRHLHGSNIIFRQDSGWHEYGAYIGYFVFALALLSLSHLKKRRLVRALFISAVAAILLSSIGPALQPYFDHLPFLPRSNISRFILFGIIPIALLSGYGFDLLLNQLSLTAGTKTPTGKLIVTALSLILISFVSIDLFSFSSQLSSQSFILPRVANPPPPAPYPIAYTAQKYDQYGNSSRTTRSYTAILQGYGTLTYCSVLGPDPMVRTIHDEVDNGLLLAIPPVQSVELIAWNPNEAIFNIAATTPAKIILNSNFAPGWKAQTTTNQTIQELPVFGDAGRVAVNILPGRQIISFNYHARGFVSGLIVTVVTIAIACYLLLTKQKHALS